MMLENKSGLTSSAELAREEERISKNKAAELFDRNLLDSFPADKPQHCRKFIPRESRV